MSTVLNQEGDHVKPNAEEMHLNSDKLVQSDDSSSRCSSTILSRKDKLEMRHLQSVAAHGGNGHAMSTPLLALRNEGVFATLSDTPISTTYNSPIIPSIRTASSTSTPRIRPTTLDIPGLTKSKASPDGRIAQQDVGNKLVIVMVGLPARGKSYITKKMARYLNWLQHDTRIFNVGERRRAAGGNTNNSSHGKNMLIMDSQPTKNAEKQTAQHDIHQQATAKILVNGKIIEPMPPLYLPSPVKLSDSPFVEKEKQTASQDITYDKFDKLESQFTELERPSMPEECSEAETMDQSAGFFDPKNKQAVMIRERVAMESLDELLDYILEEGGSVGILDATNSTISRRQHIMCRVRERAGMELNVLFIESVCENKALLESNMRLKLSGPDYKDKDPCAALQDFKKRVAIYENNYVPIGEYEEDNNIPYVKMIDVGRKVISHQIRGFLSAQAVYYLLNFNLAPRQIWITRHGESIDNMSGRIGGDSDLTENGQKYAKAMARFIEHSRVLWERSQLEKAAKMRLPPHPGDHTPPNPHYNPDSEDQTPKNFCVWTSMLKRSIKSAEYFNEENYDIKQMRMLDDLNLGVMDGLTHEELRDKYEGECNLLNKDKLQYRYPGPGGESYLDVINRLRPVIVELERMTYHCLLITHLSVARVLLAYFLGLRRDEVADLDCPLGMLYMLEPKPFGVNFKAYRYKPETDWFEPLPDFKLQPSREVDYE